jgi:hypothetical protein
MAASKSGSPIATSGGEPNVPTIARVSEVTMRPVYFSSFSLIFLSACSGGFFEISGSVYGQKIDEGSAYWGGPYVVFMNTEMGCDEMSWVEDKYALDTDELSTESTINALQFTYASTEVQDGKLTIASQNSPAVGWFLSSNRGEADTFRSISGNIDTTIDGDWLSGTFEVDFGEDGSLSGDFEVKKCENLKPRR